MKYKKIGDEIEISDTKDFDITKIFECGQCFRWNCDNNGVYHGVAFGRPLSLRSDNNSVFLKCTQDEFENIWYDYFDLSRDYSSIRKQVSVDGYMTRAAEYGAGIRILRQDKWETLCSFILSQCNNIPRIKKIVEALCSNFGDEIVDGKDMVYSFPDAERISALNLDDLACLHCGYRAPYILDAARAVADGTLDLEALAEGSFEEAVKKLKSINGIGDKVANCVILFGFQMLNAFPIDVWIKKVLSEHYDKNFDPKIFGEYAGIAQQYMFYYARQEGK